MTEAIATVPVNDEATLALLGGSAYEGQENYIASPNYFTCVWRKSGDAAKDAAAAAGFKIEKGVIVFGYTKAGSFELFRPFQFYLVAATPIFNQKDDQGKVIKTALEAPDDSWNEGYTALLVAKQGKSLIPMVATVGRFDGGMGKAIKQARLKVQDYAKPDLRDRGDQFAVAAGIAAVPYRVVFTLAATEEEGKKGAYLKGNVSGRPATQDDVDILEHNEVTDPSSVFYKDFKECFKVYQGEVNKAKAGE